MPALDDTNLVREYLSHLGLFTAPDCDRFGYLVDLCRQSGLSAQPVTLARNRFLMVRSPEAASLRLEKLFTAHYDRAAGSPGANDNSAAVLALLFFFRAHYRAGASMNATLLFTDQEEVPAAASPTGQGTFQLGKRLRATADTQFVSFHFDMCGRGDTLIISQAGERLLERRRRSRTALYRNMQTLKTAVMDGLADGYRGRVLSLPTPFSDNLGFLLQGIPSLQLTMLPAGEAYAYQRKFNQLSEKLSGTTTASPEEKTHIRRQFREIQPATWKLRHTADDTVASLEPRSFFLLQNLFSVLVNRPIPLL
ncbi:MAG TPA: M28 family peptidase [Spirochaetia bacterium]|nr:M28 family peptidase [Spirochaetia bacterium]